MARTAVGSGTMTHVSVSLIALPTVLAVSEVLMFLSTTVCREVEHELTEKKLLNAMFGRFSLHLQAFFCTPKIYYYTLY